MAHIWSMTALMDPKEKEEFLTKAEKESFWKGELLQHQFLPSPFFSLPWHHKRAAELESEHVISGWLRMIRHTTRTLHYLAQAAQHLMSTDLAGWQVRNILTTTQTMHDWHITPPILASAQQVLHKPHHPWKLLERARACRTLTQKVCVMLDV